MGEAGARRTFYDTTVLFSCALTSASYLTAIKKKGNLEYSNRKKIIFKDIYTHPEVYIFLSKGNHFSWRLYYQID